MSTTEYKSGDLLDYYNNGADKGEQCKVCPSYADFACRLCLRNFCYGHWQEHKLKESVIDKNATTERRER